MGNKYYAVNIRDFLDENSEVFIGENALQDILSEFSCRPNLDVEYFLLHNAIEFTKKSQSVTYLVFNKENGNIVGYYTLAIKPITILSERLSNNAKKKLERVSVLDEASQSYTVSAYLIAQLGKNYALENELQIPGRELLAYAYEQIKAGKHSFGGVIAFLECEDKSILLDFYQKNGHNLFNKRETKAKSEYEPHFLHQLMKFV